MPLLGRGGAAAIRRAQYRLESEYGAECRLESAPWSIVRWLREKNPAAPVAASPATGGVRKVAAPVKPAVSLPTGVALAQDPRGLWVVLFPTAWTVRYFSEQNPGWEVRETP